MRLENVWLRYHRRGPWVLRETVMATARALTGSLAAPTVLLLSLWAAAWAAVALAGYAWRRRSRA
ncbi:hypothetical protein [Micromonospora inositola]|uniref:Uncharacterized protein n=1 Tax=Micromonospora inositola TaxID=47865 RepID=A0A1C5IB68_9ACTN|nr:hypothetical protein [Micromonospora inositola]SCG55652.1 hypothetical protein GA0070613_2576 [Micromonospora inositola]